MQLTGDRLPPRMRMLAYTPDRASPLPPSTRHGERCQHCLMFSRRKLGADEPPFRWVNIRQRVSQFHIIINKDKALRKEKLGGGGAQHEFELNKGFL